MSWRPGAHPRWVITISSLAIALITLTVVLLFVGPGKQATGPRPTPTPFVSPSLTPGPSATAPTASPSSTPTAAPTPAPSQSPTSTATATATAAPTPSPAPAGCVNIANWTVAERLNELIMVSGDFSKINASIPYARAGVGAFVFFGQPAAGSGPAITAGMASLYNNARASGQVVPWVSTDEEGGSVARLSSVIGALPSARQMAFDYTPAQVRSMMAAHAAAMWNLGVIMDLAPVGDTASPSNTLADESQRSFSENGQVAAAYSLAYAGGLQASGVVPVIKHFPGLGHASANTDLGPATDPSLSQLEANDLIPFEQAIAQGLPVIMISHASVPGLTGTVPASLSPATYRFLRGSLHFNGVTLTDSLSAGAIADAGYSQASAAVTAIEAGADMVMIHDYAWQSTLDALKQAVNSGALPISQVNASVTRILHAKGLPVCP